MLEIRQKTTVALGWLVPALFLLFPVAMALSNVVLLLLLIGFVLTFSSVYLKRDAWSSPAIWLMALFGAVLGIGCRLIWVNTPSLHMPLC